MGITSGLDYGEDSPTRDPAHSGGFSYWIGFLRLKACNVCLLCDIVGVTINHTIKRGDMQRKHIWITDYQVEDIGELADKNGIGFSEQVRWLLSGALGEVKMDDSPPKTLHLETVIGRAILEYYGYGDATTATGRLQSESRRQLNSLGWFFFPGKKAWVYNPALGGEDEPDTD